jgi:hypothetical protein
MSDTAYIDAILKFLLHTHQHGYLEARIIAAVKIIDAPMLTRVWQELEYSINVCRATRGARIEHLKL